MEYSLCFFFAVWFVSSTIASEEWVQVPIIGHQPKGAGEKRIRDSAHVGTLNAPPSTTGTKTTVRAANGHSIPSNTPFSSTEIPPSSTKAPSSSKLPQSPKLEDHERPELRMEPGLPVDEFMRAHETLSQYGRGSVVEKINFLGHLKKQLLRKTAELMPRAIIALGGRSPATTSEGRGHKGIGFPSSEGTLMSLCFLVFAVFLVKIVMQLIQGLQNNALGVVTSAATRTARSNWDKTHTEEELLRLLESLQHHKRAWMQP